MNLLWNKFDPESPELQRGLDLNRPVGYRAVVWQGERDDRLAQRLRSELLAAPGPAQEIWPGIWLALANAGTAAGRGESIPGDPAMAALNSVRALVPEMRPGLVQSWEFRPGDLFTPGRSVFRCALRRGPDLLYFDSAERLLWRFSRY
jgi:hypothetical protein